MRELFILIGSLLLLALGAEVLVRGAAALARRFGVSSFFIGLTIVGFGTSTPELFTSITAALAGRGDLAVGNCVGSNIFNVGATLGLVALIRPIAVRATTVSGEVWRVLFVSLVPFVALFTGGLLGLPFGCLCLSLLLVFVLRGYAEGRRAPAAEQAAKRELDHELGLERPGWRQAPVVHLVSILAGLALLLLGSDLLVTAASAIARRFGVSELAIGLTIVAAGTSAPELVTSLVAVVRRQSDISVGNILGSNIFNMLGILGTTCIVRPQQVNSQVLRLDAPYMVATAAVLLPLLARRGRIPRLAGALLLCSYGAYLLVQFRFAPAWFSAG